MRSCAQMLVYHYVLGMRVFRELLRDLRCVPRRDVQEAAHILVRLVSGKIAVLKNVLIHGTPQVAVRAHTKRAFRGEKLTSTGARLQRGDGASNTSHSNVMTAMTG